MKTNLEEIRAAVVKACPEIGHHYCGSSYCGIDPKCLEEHSRPIRLADVLRALDINSTDRRWGCAVSSNLFAITFAGNTAIWNLALDNLDDQSEATIAFIHKILCV